MSSDPITRRKPDQTFLTNLGNMVGWLSTQGWTGTIIAVNKKTIDTLTASGAVSDEEHSMLVHAVLSYVEDFAVKNKHLKLATAVKKAYAGWNEVYPAIRTGTMDPTKPPLVIT